MNYKLPCRYQFGTIVYHRADPEKPGIITDIIFNMAGSVTYGIGWGPNETSNHYEGELTDERSFADTPEADTTQE